MREIKFRGRHYKTGKWVFGFLDHGHYQGKEIVFIHQSGSDGQTVQVVAGTEGQFIGLRDRDGKDIYEGDVVNRYERRYSASEADIPPIKMVVYWNQHGCGWSVKGVESCRSMAMSDLCMLEVIGNIHDDRVETEC